jgi:epoxyqueuosine reductase
VKAGVSFGSQDEGPAARITREAERLGFDVVGFARADTPLGIEHERYEAFVTAGMHGEMQWLAENRDTRRALDGESILAGARSVVCVAKRYARSDDASDPPTAQLLARYARGQDYHVFLRKKLRKLAAFIRALGTEDAPVHARPLLDDAPILERAWAARAGLGFVGKNGVVIVPGMGSFVLLGEIVTTLELPAGEPMAERCGSCTRCLDACPTDAFERPFVLDARRCVAYLTIEQRGPIPDELRAGVGEHLFGCDDCQTVCPFNRASRESVGPSPFAPLARWSDTTLADLLSLDDDTWMALSTGSPVHRATREGLARNAATVLGNRGGDEGDDELRRAAAEHPSDVVRDAAAWALVKRTGA